MSSKPSILIFGYVWIAMMLPIHSSASTEISLQKPSVPIQQERSNQEMPPVDTIEAVDLKQLIDQTPSYSNPDECPFVVINVLGNKLFGDCHITGSLNVPLYDLYQIALEWEKKSWLFSKEFICYCALNDCDASIKAYYMLKGMGVTKVRAYEGGIREWYMLGLPVTGACVSDYLRNIPCIKECRKMVIEECGRS